MTFTLRQTQTVSDLAGLLYDFLPGTPHPSADQSISFPGVANALGLGKFWSTGSKKPAIVRLLGSTFQYEAQKFCPLIVNLVRTGLDYRLGKGDPIRRTEIDQLNRILSELGFKIPELREPKFLSSLREEANLVQGQSKSRAINEKVVQELRKELLDISVLPPVQRGFAFEKMIGRLSEAFDLAPQSAFRLVGEQVDGSLQILGETYLVEATWRGKQVGQEELLIFSGKVLGKAQWSRGLLISYAGFSQDGLAAFSRGRRTNIICMDGLDIHEVLERKLDLREVIERKTRKAAETNEAFVPVRDLFP